MCICNTHAGTETRIVRNQLSKRVLLDATYFELTIEKKLETRNRSLRIAILYFRETKVHCILQLRYFIVASLQYAKRTITTLKKTTKFNFLICLFLRHRREFISSLILLPRERRGLMKGRFCEWRSGMRSEIILKDCHSVLAYDWCRFRSYQDNSRSTPGIQGIVNKASGL